MKGEIMVAPATTTAFGLFKNGEKNAGVVAGNWAADKDGGPGAELGTRWRGPLASAPWWRAPPLTTNRPQMP